MTLNFATTGQSDRPAVILVHGLFGDLDNLKSISRALESEFYVVNLDLRNHGHSPWTDTMSFAEMAADIQALMHQLSIPRAHLLGHSLGGKVVMEFALTYPDACASLVVADIAPVAYDARHTHIIDALETLDLTSIASRQAADQQLAEHISEPGVRAFLLKNLRKTPENRWEWRMNLAGLRRCYADLIGAPQRTGQFKGPVLFIRGGNSDYVTSAHRSAIAERFPQAQAKTIANTGHWLHAEKPSVFNGIVLRFLHETGAK